jgi:hypothetical protein
MARRLRGNKGHEGEGLEIRFTTLNLMMQAYVNVLALSTSKEVLLETIWKQRQI